MDEANIEAYKITFLKGIGPVRLKKIVREFGSCRNFLCQDMKIVSKFLKQNEIEEMYSLRFEKEIKEIKEKLFKFNVNVIFLEDESYPLLLKEIYDPPKVLFLKGKIKNLNSLNLISVVGTRKNSVYGSSACKKIVSMLAINSFSIVSGLANGIDSIAHSFALKNGAKTIAVMPCEIEKIYPSSNKWLYNEILENGAVISEYLPGTILEKGMFARRNRIIAGLSKSLIVIEAGEKSGALVTAKCAQNESRDVYAVPSSIFLQSGKGTNKLIALNYAKLIVDEDELMKDLGCLNFKVSSQFEKKLTEDQKKLLSLIDSNGSSIEEIKLKSVGFSSDLFYKTLADLELESRIELLNGRYLKKEN